MSDSPEPTTLDYISAFITLAAVIAKVAPEFASWVRDVTSGKTDPISIRVASILPEESASRAAQHTLGG